MLCSTSILLSFVFIGYSLGSESTYREGYINFLWTFFAFCYEVFVLGFLKARILFSSHLAENSFHWLRWMLPRSDKSSMARLVQRFGTSLHKNCNTNFAEFSHPFLCVAGEKLSPKICRNYEYEYESYLIFVPTAVLGWVYLWIVRKTEIGNSKKSNALKKLCCPLF